MGVESKIYNFVQVSISPGKDITRMLTLKFTYSKVEGSNTSRLEEHAGFFKLLMKGIFNPYVL